jgi:hypothetical protein
MALLASPSSPDEAQGTNGMTYESAFASVISSLPKMIIQSLGDEGASALTWAGDKWVRGSDALGVTTITFAPELNVGGKYIFGASEGGWRPAQQGNYRITLYFPGSDISLRGAVAGNFVDWAGGESSEEGEARAGQPVVDQENNVTYVDVVVSAGGGGSGGSGGSGGHEGEGEEGDGEEDGGGVIPEPEALPSSALESGGGSSNSPYPGCMNTSASNYNKLANIDDGSCIISGGGKESGSGASSGALVQGGEVLGAATITEPVAENIPVCKPYLRDYLKMGKANDKEQVVLLQSFLNEVMGVNLPLTGYFGSMTRDAVKKFQVAHHGAVIQPWEDMGYSHPILLDGTGIVYITTLKQINSMKCAMPG